MKTVKKIEVTRPVLPTRKKVAAYARVSMETDRMMHSISTQVSYYSELIQSNPEWEYAGVYADNFISGTAIDRRQEFKRLLEDCEAGKIEILSAVWIQSHDSSGNEPPFEYPLKPLFNNRYKHRKRSEPLTFISCPEHFCCLFEKHKLEFNILPKTHNQGNQ